MKQNVGNVDRYIRIILGLVIIVWGFVYSNWLGLIGLVPLITGLVNFCPIYGILGLSTKPKVESEKLNSK